MSNPVTTAVDAVAGFADQVNRSVEPLGASEHLELERAAGEVVLVAMEAAVASKCSVLEDFALMGSMLFVGHHPQQPFGLVLASRLCALAKELAIDQCSFDNCLDIANERARIESGQPSLARASDPTLRAG